MRINYRKIIADFRFILFIYLTVSFLGIFLLKYFQYPVNADGIAYISIANTYVNGNLDNAINGYWGPLLSWLIAPFLLFNPSPIDTLIIGEIISVIVGFFILIGIRSLSSKFMMNENLRIIIMYTSIGLVSYFWLRAISPDLLILCFLIFYLNIIFSKNYIKNQNNGYYCGLLGAFAFLSKSYALAFFLFHFIPFNFLHYKKVTSNEDKSKVIKNLLLGLIVFFIISGAWIGVISDKYGKITLGTSGEYNQNLMGPSSTGHPVFFNGLIHPPNKSALSSWDDPYYIEIASWSPLKSWKYFNYQMQLIWKNIHDSIDILLSFSYLSLIIILFYILLALKSSKDNLLKGKLIYPLLTIAIFSAGYVLILVEERYLWIIYILLLLMGGFMLERAFQHKFFNKDVRYVIIILFIWSFLALPAASFTHVTQGNIDTEGVYDLSQHLRMDYGVSGNIASNDRWQKSLYLSFYLNSKYYGQIKPNISDTELKSELESNNIDYYFVWDNSNNNWKLLSHYNEITGGKFDSLKVYSIKEKKL